MFLNMKVLTIFSRFCNRYAYSVYHGNLNHFDLDRRRNRRLTGFGILLQAALSRVFSG